MGLRLKDLLRSALKNNGIGVSALARETGISRKTLENWLEGQKPQNIEQVKTVADFFSISVDELCFGLSVRAPEAKTEFEQHQDEINAGVFEVVLRRVKK
ncbi:MAG: helix-turn-helix transcriptional regulator [Bdellovibrionales bacterium]|nr:helix-turn-helix transcriptional regulator [Bdellovibrionales bacterium]